MLRQHENRKRPLTRQQKARILVSAWPLTTSERHLPSESQLLRLQNKDNLCTSIQPCLFHGGICKCFVYRDHHKTRRSTWCAQKFTSCYFFLTSSLSSVTIFLSSPTAFLLSLQLLNLCKEWSDYHKHSTHFHIFRAKYLLKIKLETVGIGQFFAPLTLIIQFLFRIIFLSYH